ncbi:MAG TPA: hypothetical protein VER98_04865, partial [Terriglobia bacterium]|nr:hypothetical protein [Terriglobia bacterium]
MPRSARIPEDDKGRLEDLPETFASVRVEIERVLTELHTLEAHFKEGFQQSLVAAALAVEDQLKEAVSAAEQMVGKQTLEGLRAKYVKELELALTEKAMIERRFQTATKKFEDEKQGLAAKLGETEQALAKL